MNSLLLVDDEEAICSQFQQTLERFGFQVEMAHTSESAIHIVEQTQFDAILVELNIKSEQSAHPRSGHGLTVIRRLRALQVAAPVLMFTAMKGELYETASLDANADDFIPKTTSVPSVVSRIRAHIRRNNRESRQRTEPEMVSI